MATKKIEIQDSNGNVYYPHTDASVVKNGSKTVAEQLNDLENNKQDKITDSGWIDLPLNSQVTAYNSSSAPKYRKIGNMVEIRGSIKISGNISSSSGLNFATLPAGFRPSQTIGVVCEGSVVSKWYLNISNDSGALNVDRYSENGSTIKTTFAGNEWLPFQCTFFIN